MKKEYEDFLLNEYGHSRIAPAKISVGKYDFLIPFAYANPLGNFKLFENALFSKYTQNQNVEIEKYRANGYSKIPTLRFTDTIIVAPYRLRDLTQDQAKERIVNEIYKRYTKAIRLTMTLKFAYPNSKYCVRVEPESIKKLDIAYNKYLADTFKDKVLVSAAKIDSFAKKKISTFRGIFKYLSSPLFKEMNKQYQKRIYRAKSLLDKNHGKLMTIAGVTALAGILTFGAYKSNSKVSDKKANATELRELNTAKNSLTSDVKNKIPTTIDASSLPENVKKFLKERGFDKLNSVQAHNLEMYIKTRNVSNNLIAFAENFHSTAYDDNKGFPTIAYGCTNYLDEKGQPLEKVGKDGKKSAFVQFGQTATKEEGMEQVNRVSDFTILPKILDLVKVKMDEKQSIVTKNFAFITHNKFEETKYLEALNSKCSNEYLSQCMALWKVDAGLPKRLFVLNLILTGKIKAQEIQNFRPASCYDLTLDQCLACHKNPNGSTRIKKVQVTTREKVNGRLKSIQRIQERPDYKLKNGLPYFNTDTKTINACIEKMRAKPNETCVDQIVPSACRDLNLYAQGTKNEPNLISVYQQQKNGRNG